jgi:hypothetical protein
MKKFILLLLVITFTTTSAYALKSHYNKMPAGEYRCAEGGETCIINKYKNGEITFNEHCLEDETSTISKYAPQIKRNNCKILPDPAKYYVCEFADTKCWVTFYPSRSKVACKPPKNKKLTPEKTKAINARVEALAREGKCRELYTEQTPQENANKN